MIVLSVLSPIENIMRSILVFLHDSVGLPWAWSIVALTIIVRIALVPLTVRQIHSMQSLQKHAPEMKELQRKYKGDRQKLNEELMKFYKENSINPAASCLPLAAQIPVFFSLYFVLKHFTKHIHASPHELGWLHVVPNIANNANTHWSGYLLLAIYAGSQILSTWFMSTTMDKTQRWIMMVVPLVFITVVARFPVGLVVYWVTTNLWTVGQGLITRRLVQKTPAPAPDSGRRSSRTPPKEDEGTSDNGASPEPADPKPAPSAGPRQVRRKKSSGRRR